MIQKKFSLKNFNTFGIEVETKYFCQVNSVEELQSVLENPLFKNLPILFLGGGSNVLITKKIEGITILMNLKGIEEKIINENEVIVSAKAGENWHDFVEYTLKKNYGGLENLSLIPGNVGTSPIQNIGAYGTEIKDHFSFCKVLNLKTKQIVYFSKKDCQFGYRDSFFKQHRNQFAILEVGFSLTRNHHKLNLKYHVIHHELEKMKIEHPTIQDISRAIINIRQSKLPNPKMIGNAGSFFKNPTISRKQFNELEAIYSDIKGFSVSDNDVKVYAGWLIEKIGWKGKQIGNVATHTEQALVIINKTGNASGKEVYDFSEQLIQEVKNTFNITLEREVNII